MVPKMPLDAPPSRGSRFGSPLVLSRVYWVRSEMVVEVSYIEWTPDGLLRHVAYLGEREDNCHRSPPRPTSCLRALITVGLAPLVFIEDIGQGGAPKLITVSPCRPARIRPSLPFMPARAALMPEGS
jgi:bifunctional non-homologous end joining protein LigD